MSWVFHDSFKSGLAAKRAGNDMLKLGFVKGIKITKQGKKSRPFMLFIIPIKLRETK
jgi:hypothetical protein